MNVESFLRHWSIRENPFRAEEAREDPVYLRIMDSEMTHPDFDKIYGSPDHPGTSVVFGEKGSGKTATRLLIEERLRQYNEANPERKVWIARHDDLNPMLDSIVAHSKSDSSEALKSITIGDHMDALLALVTTCVIDFLTGDDLDVDKPRKRRRQLRKMPYPSRLDLAVLAMLYDQRKTGNPMSRWNQTLTRLRVGRMLNIRALLWTSLVVLVAAVCATAGGYIHEPWKWRLFTASGAGFAVGLAGLYYWFTQAVRAGKLARKLDREVRAVDRTHGLLKKQIGDLPLKELEPLPLPLPGNEDSRYDLIVRLRQILEHMGYASLVVLLDRVDEPALVNGQPGKMRSIIWPMLNNKFLQQDGIGFKLLLPIELRHLLRREDEDFFQKARLDKQNMIDRLVWSGSTLYDICNKRLAGCLDSGSTISKLTDLFEADVTTDDVIEALDQMKQPRDAFKFLYRVLQEHCHSASDENPEWRIAKPVLDNVRRQEAQRVQDLYRGLTPA
jgi:hypothetical protein